MEKTYSQLLKDPMWQKKRLEILSRDGFCCQLCKDTSTTLHIHHYSYEAGKKPWEYDNSNFITLCEPCHALMESYKSITDPELAGKSFLKIKKNGSDLYLVELKSKNKVVVIFEIQNGSTHVEHKTTLPITSDVMAFLNGIK